MNEQSKALPRRSRDPRFANRWFVGRGIDIGCGSDPINAKWWPKVETIETYDRIETAAYDAQTMSCIGDDRFDFAFSSHCLEHMADPELALENWLRIVRPGGFVIVAVPDELLYEGGVWPSRWNHDHKHSFTMRNTPAIPTSIRLPAWLAEQADSLDFDVEHLSLITDFWEDGKRDVDQTAGPAECAIEFVLRKSSEFLG